MTGRPDPSGVQILGEAAGFDARREAIQGLVAPGFVHRIIRRRAERGPVAQPVQRFPKRHEAALVPFAVTLA